MVGNEKLGPLPDGIVVCTEKSQEDPCLLKQEPQIRWKWKRRKFDAQNKCKFCWIGLPHCGSHNKCRGNTNNGTKKLQFAQRVADKTNQEEGVRVKWNSKQAMTKIFHWEKAQKRDNNHATSITETGLKKMKPTAITLVDSFLMGRLSNQKPHQMTFIAFDKSLEEELVNAESPEKEDNDNNDKDSEIVVELNPSVLDKFSPNKSSSQGNANLLAKFLPERKNEEIQCLSKRIKALFSMEERGKHFQMTQMPLNHE